MSGGVDSSVVAALLHAAGCEVVGITLSLWEDPDPEGPEGGCCTPEDVRDARRVCADLGVPHYVLNYREHFEAEVVAPFVASYAAGQTPNPCVRCNDHLKFDRLLQRTRELGARWLATGHYARIEDGPRGPRLLRARDEARDQSYFLAGMPHEALPAVTFPLGDLTKEQVRAAAERLAVRTRNKPDSQDICFIPDGDTARFLAGRVPNDGGGDIVTEDGAVVGQHAGVFGYTVGQRRGLGVAAGAPLYVQSIDAARRRLVVVSADRLQSSEAVAEPFVWLRRPATAEALAVKVRSRGAPVAIAAVREPRSGALWVSTEQPLRAVAPGQALVVYAGEEVLGAGTIAAPPAAVGASSARPAPLGMKTE